MSVPNSSPSYTNLDSPSVKSSVSSSSSNSCSIFGPISGDVLICGNCSSQFSDLKVFIDHKNSCGNNLTTLSSGAEIASIISSPSQPTISTQQIVLPSTGHSSIVSLPMGMPHVILQTSNGLSQMYRIILEPSLNPSSQLSPTGQISQTAQIISPLQQSNTTILDTASQYAMETEVKNVSPVTKETSIHVEKTSSQEKSNPQHALEAINNPSVLRWPSVEHNWDQEKVASRNLFEPIITNVTSGKTMLEHIGETSDMHAEEEDVATFLATQLVSQSALHNTKCRESCSSSKYCDNIHDHSQVTQGLNFIEIGPKMDTYTIQEKINSDIVNEQKNMELDINPKEHSSDNGLKETPAKTKKKIVCEYEGCKFFTMHKKDMVRHTRRHTGEKPFQCNNCGTKFSRQDKLKVHMRIHSNDRPYACTEPGCSYRGIEMAHLRKHIRTHTNERPYRCQLCPYGARDGSQLTVHLRSHTGDTPFHCQEEGCPAAFKTSSDLKRHEKLHTGEKPFKCSECDYATALKSNLKVHCRSNHFKGEKYGCKCCPFVASTRKQFKEHERLHLTQEGSSSSGSSYSKYSRPHDSQPVPNTSFINQGKTPYSDQTNKRPAFPKHRKGSKPTCLKNFKCEECGSGFVREDSYRSHVRQHLKKKSEASRNENSLGNLSKPRSKTENFINFVIQGESMILTKEARHSGKTNSLTSNEKEGKHPSILANENSIQLRSDQVGSPTTHTSSQNEEFPYVITIDGIDMYPNPTNSIHSSTRVAVPVHTSNLVHHEITSSNLNSSSNATLLHNKVMSGEERIGSGTMHQNLT